MKISRDLVKIKWSFSWQLAYHQFTCSLDVLESSRDSVARVCAQYLVWVSQFYPNWPVQQKFEIEKFSVICHVVATRENSFFSVIEKNWLNINSTDSSDSLIDTKQNTKKKYNADTYDWAIGDDSHNFVDDDNAVWCRTKSFLTLSVRFFV